LADGQIKAGRLEDAEATLRSGLEALPDSAELNYTLGLLLEHAGRADEAAPLLRRAGELGLSPPK
jgi:Flp pilus assembly protein TadD